MMTRPTNSLVISKLGATRAAQERPYKPKRSLVDFDESDESIEEEDKFDAELSIFLIYKICKYFPFIIVCRYRKELALDEGEDL